MIYDVVGISHEFMHIQSGLDISKVYTGDQMEKSTVTKQINGGLAAIQNLYSALI